MLQAKEDESIEFKWGKKRQKGGKKKDVQFYESFSYDGVQYALYDSVYMFTEKYVDEPYIGKIIKIWENPDNSKKVKTLWFFRPCEISNFLKGVKAAENELFLASGEGVGLANVNPLEAIVGKCNVICTSKDERNRQPSSEELQRADFIFYRTFDVGCHVILDKLDDKIALIDVTYLLNQVSSQKSIAVPECDSVQTQISGNATTLSSEKYASVECKPLKSGNASPKENTDSKFDHIQGHFSGDKAVLKSKGKNNAESSKLDVKHGIVGCVGNVASVSGPKKITNSDGTSPRTKVAHPKPSLAKQKSSLGGKPLSNLGTESNGVDKNKKFGHMPHDEVISRSKDDPVGVNGRTDKFPAHKFQVEERVKAKSDFAILVDKRDDSVDAPHSSKEKVVQKLMRDSSEYEDKSNHRDAKAVDKTITVCEAKTKRKLANDPRETEIMSSKKPKLDEKFPKFSNEKLPREYPGEVVSDVSKTGSKIFEVTRRPEADKSKWFKGLPWLERMQAAHAEGKLVLLQNLDPSYTGSEVQDIVWHALKQNCTARMIPRSAFCSPNSGQALAIFKTKEAAKATVTKLHEGCLVVSNGRPLVGSIAKLKLPGKPSTFFGHMSIEKTRLQMQREMREAVSTSHCSQPNTIEYDMALEWCMLQEQTDLEWQRLYERHQKELRKLQADLKSK